MKIQTLPPSVEITLSQEEVEEAIRMYLLSKQVHTTGHIYIPSQMDYGPRFTSIPSVLIVSSLEVTHKDAIYDPKTVTKLS